MIRNVLFLIDKLFVMGGWTSSNNKFAPEVHDLGSPKTCSSPDLTNYNFEAHGMAGGVVSQNHVIVCGGNRGQGIIIDQCSHVNDITTPPMPMTTERKFAAVILKDNDTLWITGGETDDGTVKTTEYVTLNGSVPGPDLKSKVDRHCFVKMNNSMAIMTGGRYNRPKARMFSFETGDWTSMTNLNTARDSHSCGHVRDKITNETIVIVTGGWTGSATLSSTELLTIKDIDDGTDFWMVGPDFPFPIQRAAGLVSSDGYSFILVGGGGYWFDNFYSGAIHKIQCMLGSCDWTLMEQELEIARAYLFAALIPKSLVVCE